MRYLITLILVLGIAALFSPPSSGDLPAWNDGTTGTITLGTVKTANANVGSLVVTNPITSISVGSLYLSNMVANIVPVFDGSTNLVPSTTTTNELAYVHGVTSAIQTQLNALAPIASPTFTGTATAPTASIATANIGSGTVTNNIGAILSVGSTTYVDATIASQTNAVSGALTFVYATNGVALVDYTVVRWIFNGSGSDQTLTIPSGWRTNVYSAVPPALTNATITKMVLNVGGACASAATQTNCYVSFEYYK